MTLTELISTDKIIGDYRQNLRHLCSDFYFLQFLQAL